MSRNIDAQTTINLSAAHVSMFPLVEMQFASGPLYVCGAAHNVTWNGNTYLAVQGLASIQEIEETDQEIKGLAFTLSGVPPAQIALALTEECQGRPCVVRLATLNGTTLNVDANCWSGILDTINVVDDESAATIQVTAEHRLITWATPRTVRFSDEDQKRLVDATDRFFEYAADMSQKAIVWPAASFFRQ